jgi:hypothetical protein
MADGTAPQCGRVGSRHIYLKKPQVHPGAFCVFIPLLTSMTKKERILLFLLAAINFTHILDFMIIMPLGNYLIPYFQISTQQFSLIVSA